MFERQLDTGDGSAGRLERMFERSLLSQIHSQHRREGPMGKIHAGSLLSFVMDFSGRPAHRLSRCLVAMLFEISTDFVPFAADAKKLHIERPEGFAKQVVGNHSLLQMHAQMN